MRKILSLILGLLWTLPAFAALPDGYTQLEYIESTGTQYIDTGVKDTSKLQMGINVTQRNSNYTILYGSQKTGTVVRRVASIAPSSPYSFAINVGSNSSASIVNTGVDATLGVFHNLTLVFGTTAQIIENGITYTAPDSGDNASTGLNDFLFTYNYGGNPNYNVKAKISYARIYGANGTLIRNFVPAKNASGVIGMYDTVGNRFYTNAGTGEFIAGDPVTTCDGTIVNYVSATGTGVQNGTPTPTNPIDPVFYTQGDMILRAVGDYKDTFDATTGKITRRVGVKVFDGTENWGEINNNRGYFIPGGVIEANYTNVSGICTHYKFNVWHDNTQSMPVNAFGFNKNGSSGLTNGNITFRPDLAIYDTVEKWQQYLAAQYAAGTPVTIYYPLAEETTEDWTESQYCNANEPIKIATTKYNESAFSPLNTALANAISVVDTVVSNTITQAGRIATLQTQKQTRPNDIADDSEKCPAGKKCLLVEDASGVPHWYEIVENAYGLPSGYTALEYIESRVSPTEAYIDTGLNFNSNYMYEITYAKGGLANVFMGARSNSDYLAVGNFSLTYNTSTCVYSSTSTNSTAVNFEDTTFGIKHTVKYQQSTSTLLFDDTNKWDSNWVTHTEIPFNVYLFAFNLGGTPGGARTEYARIYTYSVKNSNDTFVQNFVPAKNSAGVIGMYDTVNNRFYTNAGSGTFVAGPVTE